ncbi:S1C family serine protease [Deinococcus sp.]|uniref:S1C family serine protease n=1 Tax=Deinococcus sp. TaxID=47478 RepID=UPI0025E41F07|nr:S1C family serine protease [Deinococcus sp.]
MILSLGLAVVAAQASAQGAPNTAAAAAPKPLSAAEQRSLNSIFSKTRPGSLRIEQCPLTGSCEEPDGLGTGFVIQSDASGTLALTAYHVIFGARKLEAVTLNKTRYPITVIGYDDGHDVALLKINVPSGRTLAALPLASEAPKVGQSALAIGNGNGDFLVSKSGRLLALNVAADLASFPSGTLQLNAPLIPGDSGGPILNAQGEVMGVISYISARRTPFGIATDASYAVPVTKSSPLLTELRGGLKRDAPIMGLSGGPALPETLFAQLGLGKLSGAVFTEVTRGSPADLAGLRPLKFIDNDPNGVPTQASGDVITAINGLRILNFTELLSAVRSKQVGVTIKLSVVRDGKAIPDISLKLAPRTITAETGR